ncbi:MAG: hypothetical protein FWD96_07020, partial [Defluviitaleaceae bacterium]|nr:hypothetical protein [Defluviitaleaceae bacterium]
MNNSAELSVVEGNVLSIIFRNNENGYTVFSVGAKSNDEDRTVCVGIAPMIDVGDSIVARGSFVDHAKHGRQLN